MDRCVLCQMVPALSCQNETGDMVWATRVVNARNVEVARVQLCMTI